MKINISHQQINRILAIICLIIGLYLVSAPFFDLPFSKSNDFPSGKPITNIDSSKPTNLTDQPNYLEFIDGPKIRSEILEGSNIGVIDNGGLWRVSRTSNNPEISNMVVVGHNFTYGNVHPPFRVLSDVRRGNTLRLVYNNKLYNYRVTKVAVQKPTDVFIELPTVKPTLTLYTCYPMFMAKERYVVTAEKI